ncbi:MAG: hypothetical protein MI757_10295 [Pirellulales bacterium]|nr:hypothetical protein [Pirellulales bacterium]
MLRVAILLMMAIAALLLPMPELGRTGTALADLLHAPCFAILAVLVYSMLRPHVGMNSSWLAIICWAALVIFSGGTEWAQKLSDRSPSYGDIFANVAGVTAGILVAWGRERSKKAAYLAAAVLIALAVTQPVLTLIDVAIARSNFPLIASFEQPLEMRRWSEQNSAKSRVKRHATHGEWSMRIELQPAQYPGTFILLTENDWSGYETLVLDVYSEHDRLFDAIVKIEDKSHEGDYFDRFHHKATLKPGANTIRISLADVAAAPRDRAMDMTEINVLQLFTIKPNSKITLYLDNVRLE